MMWFQKWKRRRWVRRLRHMSYGILPRGRLFVYIPPDATPEETVRICRRIRRLLKIGYTL